MYYLRKPVFLPPAVLLAVFMFVAHAHALFDSNVDKAKDFMKAGMYPQAIALLEKEINDNPTNAEAHFQLGICYINQNNYSSADERFASAVRLKPEYGYKIGKEYKKVGEEFIRKGNYSRAKSLFSKAVNYQPDLKKEIALMYFDIGKSYLNQYRSDLADEFLILAENYNTSLGDEIRTITQNYGKKLLEIAKGKPKKERRRYIDEARKYLSQEAIDKIFPSPTWVTVFKKTYIGKGYDKEVQTAQGGKDIKYKDKLIVEGEEFELYHGGKFRRYTGRVERISKCRDCKGRVIVRAPKGKKFIVEVQRLKEYY